MRKLTNSIVKIATLIYGLGMNMFPPLVTDNIINSTGENRQILVAISVVSLSSDYSPEDIFFINNKNRTVD